MLASSKDVIQPDGARHVLKLILNPHFMSCMASYDVTSTIHQSLPGGHAQAAHVVPGGDERGYLHAHALAGAVQAWDVKQGRAAAQGRTLVGLMA